MLREFFAEILDEAGDFFEDIAEHVFRIKPKHPRLPRTVTINGIATAVRPAYFFAERIDHLLRIFFGITIVLSAISSTFLGFATLSGLLDVLINTIPGRIIMLVIGFSYLMISFWKLMHIHPENPNASPSRKNPS
jgi:hypothetical protein